MAASKQTAEATQKHGFHFASDGLHMAEYIQAATIEDATAIYHKTKRLIDAGGIVSTPAPAGPNEQAAE